MKKQTGVEWLAQWLNDNPVVYQKDYYAAIEWAKAMEREQIIEAWKNGSEIYDHSAEQYYNEIYGGDKWLN